MNIFLDWESTMKQVSLSLMKRREAILMEMCGRLIGHRCPVSAEDMMTVLWARGFEMIVFTNPAKNEMECRVYSNDDLVEVRPLPTFPRFTPAHLNVSPSSRTDSPA